ncbi:MAG: FlgD immunoglobulin-like domain containing protein, partial [Armatimonadia bacterium]
MFRRGFVLCLLCGGIVSAAGAGWAGTTTRVSDPISGGGSTDWPSSMSADGRYVAFAGQGGVCVHDCLTGQTTRVDVATGGTPGNDSIRDARISANGRYVVFVSCSSNLVPGDTNESEDIFVHDRATGRTSMVVGPYGMIECASISDDGRYVAFESEPPGLIQGVFLSDRTTGTTTDVNVSETEHSWYPSISADGRHIVFRSSSSDLVPVDTNGQDDVFVRHLATGETTMVSVATSGLQANGWPSWGRPSISSDGRYVAFGSTATNLVANDTNSKVDVFVHDCASAQTTRVSVATGGAQGDLDSGYPSISADGRFVAFVSDSTNLVSGDTNGDEDVFVRDRTTGQTTRVSVATGGAQGNNSSSGPSISADGRYVAFMSSASNLVAGDTNGCRDVFVHDTLGVTTPPTTPTTVTITPSAPGREPLTGTATGSTVANGDTLTYQYQWSKKTGTSWGAFGYTGRTLAAANVKVGDIWRVRARAFDGALYSAWKGGSSVKIVTMAGVLPAHKTYNVPVTSPVFISFRWPVQQSTATARVRLRVGITTVKTTMTWATANRKIKLRPASNLAPNTYYHVIIDPGIVCVGGRVLNWSEDYWFKTAPAATVAAVSVAAAPTASGAQVTVNLSSAATVRTVICNIAGRVVAELSERDLPAGLSTLVWNGKGSSGTKVPAGTYLVRVDAMGAEGTQA